MADFAGLSDEIAAAFSLGAVHRPLVLADRGEQALVWRLETERRTYAVKQPLRGFEPRVDGTDIAFQEAVLAQTSVRLAAPVRRPDGHYLGNVGGHLLRVAEWVELAPATTQLDPELVGQTLAALHRVDVPVQGSVHPWHREPVGGREFNRLARRLERAGAPFAGDLRAAIPRLVALEGMLEHPGSPRMCHCDLWAVNMRGTPDGGICVIDWDNCGPADPGHELAMVIYEFGYPDDGRIKAIHAAYVAAGGPARLTRPEQLTMVIAQFGHFYELGARRWLERDVSADEQAHLVEWLAELEDRPLSVAACRQIIASVARGS